MDIDILKGGGGGGELVIINACETFRAHPLSMTTPKKKKKKTAAERLVFDVFGVIFVVSFMIVSSLRGLHWLEQG